MRNGNARLRVSGLVYWCKVYLREMTIWTSTPAASRGRLALGSSTKLLEEDAGEPGRRSCMSDQTALGQHEGRGTALISLSTVNRSLRLHRAALLHLRGVCVCVRVRVCVSVCECARARVRAYVRACVYICVLERVHAQLHLVDQLYRHPVDRLSDLTSPPSRPHTVTDTD